MVFRLSFTVHNNFCHWLLATAGIPISLWNHPNHHNLRDLEVGKVYKTSEFGEFIRFLPLNIKIINFVSFVESTRGIPATGQDCWPSSVQLRKTWSVRRTIVCTVVRVFPLSQEYLCYAKFLNPQDRRFYWVWLGMHVQWDQVADAPRINSNPQNSKY